MRGERFNRNPRGNFFHTKVRRGMWNELPEEGVEAGTITTLKILLYSYMGRKGLEGPNACSCVDGASWSVWAS